MQAHKDLHLNTSHSCNQCPADIHNLPYTDVSERPCWEGREFTDAQFKRQFPDRAAILDVDGLTHLAIGMDSMHNKHLGVDQYYAGSVLYLLVYVILRIGHQGAHLNKWNGIKSMEYELDTKFSIYLTMHTHVLHQFSEFNSDSVKCTCEVLSFSYSDTPTNT